MYLALAGAWRAARARLRDERGFTLIELLIAMATGSIVSAATMAVVVVSLHLTSNYTDRVDANQQGRLAMTKITQALNSSCINPSVIPVLAGSSGSAITFYSSYSDTPLIVPDKITITMNGITGTPGSFVMSTQHLTGTTNNWTANGTPASFTLLPWAAPTGSTPVFQYYQYAADNTPTSLITPAGAGSTLTAAQAAEVVAVTITFQALPSDNWSANGRAADFASQVTLRLTPASSSSSASNSPCS
jgi:prepilin-type N-terminal cleavage/methylation domain-containing protein